MKRTKKLLALVLALMMAISCMAMPAMALENGAARNTMRCGVCNKYQTVSHDPDTVIYKRTSNVAGCSKTDFSHQHTIEYRNCNFVCPKGHVLATHTHTTSEICHYKG